MFNKKALQVLNSLTVTMCQSLLMSGHNKPQKYKDSTGHSHIHSFNMFFREVAAIQGFKNVHYGLHTDISITS